MSRPYLVSILACISLILHQPAGVFALNLLGRQSTAQQVFTYLSQNNQLAPYVTSKQQLNSVSGTVVITGGSSGIGAETARVLARETGMNIVLCARNVEMAEKVVQGWSLLPEEQQRIYIQYMDLSDLTSIQQAAKAIIQKCSSSSSSSGIDCILNNAGIMAIKQREMTSDGIELQFGTNHVGHHYFTRLLLPFLNKDHGRVVTVASTAHQMATAVSNNKISLDWQSKESYSPWGAYGNSKLANILFAKGLQDQLSASKRSKEGGVNNIMSVSLHPGVISSPLWKHTLPAFLRPAVGLFANKSIEQGAATNIYCVLAKYVDGGAYYDDCAVAEPNKAAIDVQNRQQLWDYTESLLTEKGFKAPQTLFSKENCVVEGSNAAGPVDVMIS